MDCIWTWPGWTAVAAIATSVAALTIFVAIRQIKEARRSTNAQIAVSLFSELRSPEVIEMLRSIYALKSYDFKPLLSKNEKEIDYVLGRFEMLGALTLTKIIDNKLAIETYGGAPALKCWYKLYDYIREVQNRRGYCFENYELFVGLCLKYFKEHKIQVKFYKKGEENEGICLVTELKNSQLSPRNTREIKKERKKKETTKRGV